MSDDVAARLERIEAHLAIGQLPIRYSLAVDARDFDTWVSLFVPDVKVHGGGTGRDALRDWISEATLIFKRSVHSICGHRIELLDSDRARGAVYCRAEHEVDDRWIVMAICYFDEYRRVGGEWLFVERKEQHWYAADINEHPQSVGYDSWFHRPAGLPGAFETWTRFWENATERAR